MTDWIDIGDCRIACGDCLEILPEFEAQSVDAVVTDPPYGIGADAGQGKRANMRHGNAVVASRDYGDTEWDSDRPVETAFVEMIRIGKEQIIFGGNYFTDRLRPSRSWIVWDKDNGTNGYADFELVWTSHNRSARKVRWRWHGMLQEHGGKDKEHRVHPTQKPTGVMVWILENYTSEGHTIFNPFMGSGTTGVACIRTGRKFIGIEKDPKYFEIARKRLENEWRNRQGRLFD